MRLAFVLLLPAVAWVVLSGLPFPPDLAVPMLITTALPTAASVFVIAQRYGVFERQSAAIFFLSHLIGIGTLTAILAMLGG